MEIYFFLPVFVLVGHSFLLAVGDGIGESGHLQDTQFKEWLAEYETMLSLKDIDLKLIYSNWKDNRKFVTQHNSLGLSYKVSLNQFAHMKTTLYHFTDTEIDFTEREQVDLGDIPDSVDWRQKGVVSPVKNQGAYDNSGSIAVVDCLASFWAIKTGMLVSPSLQELDDCCGSHDRLKFVSFQCVEKIGGLALESDYPRESNNTCVSDRVMPTIIIKGGRDVAKGNETQLAEAVARLPVVVLVDAGQMSFQLYKSGVYDDPSCSREKVDHALLVVGYGKYEGKDYWLCKNSWGASWGQEGYIMIARNAHNMCGIASYATYPI